MAKKTGNLRDAVKFCSKQKDGATVPMLIEEFGRSKTTADNWLRTATVRGFLKSFKPKTGDYEGQQGHPGRPPCIYEITVKGTKWLASPEAKAMTDRVRNDLDVPRKAKAKTAAKTSKKVSKSKKTATKPKTVKVKTVKMDKARKAKSDDAASKLKAKRERDAAVKREKRAASKAPVVKPEAPAPEPPVSL